MRKLSLLTVLTMGRDSDGLLRSNVISQRRDNGAGSCDRPADHDRHSGTRTAAALHNDNRAGGSASL